MRVLLSIHHPLTPDQGAPGVTYQLRKYFEERGDQARVLSFSDMPDSLLLRPATLRQLRFPWFISRQLNKLAASYDVADCSSGDAWVYQATQRSHRLLMVARSHGLEHLVDTMFREEVATGRQKQSWKYPLYHGGYRLWEVAYSFRTADLAIFPNFGDRDHAIDHLGVQPERTAVMPNGIPAAFVGLPKPTSIKPRTGQRVAVVGSYGHRKINVAPQALNKALQRHPDLQVGFLGTGIPADIVLKDYAREYHPRIEVLSNYAHAELPQLLKTYDILLFPSLSEGFGLVVYEAMACGLAVIATELNALQTYLQNEENVLFIPPANPQAIEAALNRMIVDSGFRTHLQEAGWHKAQTFCWSKIVDETSALYAEHIARKQHQRANTTRTRLAETGAGQNDENRKRQNSKVSVVIPTYRRPESLHKCLEGVHAQTRQAEEVLVIVQKDDDESPRILSVWSHWPALKILQVSGGGAIAQYNRGLAESRGDLIAITDDDSIPRTDWLSRIERLFQENDDLGGVGGRDIVHENNIPITGEKRKVGMVQWFGRVVHNHHLGTRMSPDVDILKGVNMSFRARAVSNLFLDTDLRGQGAQVCLDMAFSLAIQKRNWRLLYDPAVVVDHYPARRFDVDQRHAPTMQAVEDSSYNFYLTLRRHMRGGRRQRAALRWAQWIGTSQSPGILRGITSRLTRNKVGLEMRAAARSAWLAARQDYERKRSIQIMNSDISV